MSRALQSGRISEQSICDALMTARGDLFIASAYLHVTPRELDSYMRANEGLQAFLSAIGHVKASAEYDRLSNEQFSDALERLTREYRHDALKVIHELALMDYTDAAGVASAAMAEVKLKAAIQLRGPAQEVSVTSGQSQVLAELDNLYRHAAPRIKSIRAAVQIELD